MAGLGTLTLLTLFGGLALNDAPLTPLHEAGLDVFEPLHADRQLHLVNLQLVLREQALPWGDTKLRLGMTLQRAHGAITQLSGRYEDGTLRSTTLDSPAWGAGPVAELRWTPLRRGAFAASADLGAALMLYDRGFPAGGMRYDGMFELGPTLHWDAGAAGRWSLGARWTHLSNGHGLTPRNPSFEGRGLALRYRASF